MEGLSESQLQDSVDKINEAVDNGKPHKAESFPREAFIETAAQAFVGFHLGKINGDSGEELERLKTRMDERFDLLDERESKRAIARGNDWLSENLGGV